MTLTFVVDESVELQVVERLRDDRHELIYVAELAPGISDDEVLELANRRQALLLTADKDFGELVFRQGRVTAGVLLVRLTGFPASRRADLVAAAIRNRGADLTQRFAVLSSGGLRIRSRF